jgi:hypothetical protein
VGIQGGELAGGAHADDQDIRFYFFEHHSSPWIGIVPPAIANKPHSAWPR